MTTPNIKELMQMADVYAAVTAGAVSDADRYKIGLRTQEARAALEQAIQSQAERINELEQALQTGPEIIAGLFARAVNMEKERDELREKYTDTYWALDDAARENTSLRAQLTEIEKTEPVASINELNNARMFSLEAGGYSRKDKLFARPMPTQDVTELVDCLSELCDIVEGVVEDKSSVGSLIDSFTTQPARTTLSKYKGAK